MTVSHEMSQSLCAHLTHTMLRARQWHSFTPCVYKYK